MKSNRTPVEVACAAAEKIRALNHRAQRGNDPGPREPFPSPRTVYDTVTVLHTLLERLPQPFDQKKSGKNRGLSYGARRHRGGGHRS
ncbi:hypothetical protein [Kitasatospora sp. NPDC001175]|uniref:hypothetical protein n=1 Tax=Kitasatospora sp. NPDC001175 TaxID=3157103 RepID=UPI003CFE885B